MNGNETRQYSEGFGSGLVTTGGKGRPPRPKLPHATKLSVADPQTAQEALLSNPGAMTFPARKHPLQPRKTKLAVLGIPAPILDNGSPEYARCVRLAQAYKKARTKEIFDAYGYVSSGTSALLAAASLALSASRFLYETAASTPLRPSGDDRGLSMPQILKLASSLSDSARQNELSAWELAARESVIKKRNSDASRALPWMVESVSGETKRGKGRPRSVQVVTEENNARTELPGETESSSTAGAWAEASRDT